MAAAKDPWDGKPMLWSNRWYTDCALCKAAAAEPWDAKPMCCVRTGCAHGRSEVIELLIAPLKLMILAAANEPWDAKPMFWSNRWCTDCAL
eukprot:11108592-Karenia_brevis.AAC.1